MLKEKGEKKSSLSLLMPGKCLYFILVGGGDLRCRGGEISFPLPSQVQWLKPVRIGLIEDRLTREKTVLITHLCTDFHKETRVQEAAR